ncbi:MAG: nicotinate (nicotinamide) nucleotide adenylyltransferase [Oscillospiraceae bacterium]
MTSGTESLKIGIYGGTFNPIHNGHLHIMEEFYQRLKLDKMILIPTYLPPHKTVQDLASPRDRFAMCALAAKTLRFPVEISEIEINRRERSYTADTLVELRRGYPNAHFYLLMGEDMFLTIDHWYLPEVIFATATVCASPRSAMGMNGLREYAKKLEEQFKNAHCVIADIPFLDVSSTEIRAGVSRDLPQAVATYIREKSLYTTPSREE